jgi:hypothetical protein
VRSSKYLQFGAVDQSVAEWMIGRLIDSLVDKLDETWDFLHIPMNMALFGVFSWSKSLIIPRYEVEQIGVALGSCRHGWGVFLSDCFS